MGDMSRSAPAGEAAPGPRHVAAIVDAPGSGAGGVVGVAVSGGRDSIALLHATVQAARTLGLRVVALHVHHGLMADADAWAERLEAQCGRWAAQGLPVGF